MKSKAVSILCVLIICSCVSAAAFADVVELRSGEIVRGEITEKTDEFVAIETDSGTSFFRREDVESMQETSLEAAAGNVVEVTGTVDVLPKGEKQWVAVQEGAILNEGDLVRTGPDSKAIAVIENQVIMAVEPTSNLHLEKMQQSPKKEIDIKVHLDNGQIWTDVGALRTKQAAFYVTTPAAVTGVRGTVFTVEAGAGDKTTVAVVEGGVEVRTRDLMMEPVQVKKSQMTEVTPNKPPTAPTVISGGFLAQWAVYQAKFGLLRSGMTQGFQLSPGQAAVGGAVAAGAVAAAAASSGGGGGGSVPAPSQTVIVTASENGLHSPTPIDTDIDGSSAIGGRAVTGVTVRVFCDPFTVADQFQIIYMGNVIGDTGIVGEDLGDPGENILLAGSANGASPIVTIRVISGPLGTDWNWDARVTYHVQ